MGMSESERLSAKMAMILSEMRQSKPNDRTDYDRRWAVAITQMEVAIAVFHYQVVRFDVQGDADGS